MYEVVIRFDDDSIARSVAAMIRDTHGLECEVRPVVQPDQRWEAVREWMQAYHKWALGAIPGDMRTELAGRVIAAIDAGRGGK